MAFVLGEKTSYKTSYDPNLLCFIPRQEARCLLGLKNEIPFFGQDLWRCFEVSWLDKNGKPKAAYLELVVPCKSKALVESKSLKLYLNALNQTCFESEEEVTKRLKADLEEGLGCQVDVTLNNLLQTEHQAIDKFNGICLDDLDTACKVYQPQPRLLQTASSKAEETLYTHLFRSCCPVTGQPDWASVEITYQGSKIDHEGLLQYLVSFREHSGFHENCVEKIYLDILATCNPQRLMVQANFTRRGGIDINPFRSSHLVEGRIKRLFRQ